MTHPFHYRPPDAAPGTEETDWEDNATSNTLAYLSATITPDWCQTPQHWTQQLADHLFTTCPCCMVFRGLTLGAIGGFTLCLALWALVTLLR